MIHFSNDVVSLVKLRTDLVEERANERTEAKYSWAMLSMASALISVYLAIEPAGAMYLISQDKGQREGFMKE